ncbi:H(+)-transporting ATPase [Candidatus Saccharibacteria bacterium]|nr:MAG: H(+)-transporting ATPase [Candidatus Saccharibacteria bacterium]
MNDLAIALAYSISALGGALGVGLIGNAALGALGRNPEKANEIRTMMILAIAFTDALAIIGFVLALLIKFV